MRAIFNLTENYRTPTGCPPGADPADPACVPEFVNNTGTGGNPNLKQLKVSQADIALEWYPSAKKMLYEARESVGRGRRVEVVGVVVGCRDMERKKKI